MKKLFRILVSGILVSGILVSGILVFPGCNPGNGESELAFESFLSEQDLVIDTLTPNWHEGAFSGNGLLGCMVYLDEDSAGVRIEIGRTDVVDHRPEFGVQYGEFRLPIGKFVLRPEGTLQRASVRMELPGATVSGTIYTENRASGYRIFTHAAYDVIVLETETEAHAELSFLPSVSRSPRFDFQNKWSGIAPVGYTANPDPAVYEEEGIHYCYQPLISGGGYTTAWKKVVDGETTRYYISVGNSYPQDISVREAKRNIRHALEVPYHRFVEMHEQWWHEFYERSYVELPDNLLEQFWWIQQYKLG